MKTITSKDFAEAKKAVKKAGTADVSLADRVAREVLVSRCPSAPLVLIADMAWQVVLAAR